MEINIDQTHWYDRIWAALIFFTRLPFWRLHQPPKECYSTVVEHWPLVGWLTGGVGIPDGVALGLEHHVAGILVSPHTLKQRLGLPAFRRQATRLVVLLPRTAVSQQSESQ